MLSSSFARTSAGKTGCEYSRLSPSYFQCEIIAQGWKLTNMNVNLGRQPSCYLGELKYKILKFQTSSLVTVQKGTCVFPQPRLVCNFQDNWYSDVLNARSGIWSSRSVWGSGDRPHGFHSCYQHLLTVWPLLSKNRTAIMLYVMVWSISICTILKTGWQTMPSWTGL